MSLRVHHGHRGRGVGHALPAAAEDHLFAAGADRIFARAADEPGAAAFAERHGYRRTRPVTSVCRAGTRRSAHTVRRPPPCPTAPDRA
ncbi:GNAT family N-acetyltransferase [Streptomyces lydicus]|uniref:GNAT family N-acetyltransferase n=1 Tax=Streptomyces lydicus TaxID=47763 RepID=UPI003689679E